MGSNPTGFITMKNPPNLRNMCFFNKSALIFVFCWRRFFDGFDPMGFIAILHHHLFCRNMFGSLFPIIQPANLSKRCITKNYVTSNTHLVGEENSKPPESGFCGEFSVNPPVVVSSGTFMRISHFKIGKKSWW